MFQNEQIFSEKVKWKSNSRIKSISEFDLRTLTDNKLIVIFKLIRKVQEFKNYLISLLKPLDELPNWGNKSGIGDSSAFEDFKSMDTGFKVLLIFKYSFHIKF